MSRERAVMIGVFSAGVVWQVYVVIAAFRYAPEFNRIFESMAVELPLITRALFATYRFWVVVPIVFAALSAHALISTRVSVWYVGALAFACVLAGFVMQAWLFEGYFTPLFAIVKQIG